MSLFTQPLVSDGIFAVYLDGQVQGGATVGEVVTLLALLHEVVNEFHGVWQRAGPRVVPHGL